MAKRKKSSKKTSRRSPSDGLSSFHERVREGLEREIARDAQREAKRLGFPEDLTRTTIASLAALDRAARLASKRDPWTLNDRELWSRYLTGAGLREAARLAEEAVSGVQASFWGSSGDDVVVLNEMEANSAHDAVVMWCGNISSKWHQNSLSSALYHDLKEFENWLDEAPSIEEYCYHAPPAEGAEKELEAFLGHDPGQNTNRRLALAAMADFLEEVSTSSAATLGKIRRKLRTELKQAAAVAPEDARNRRKIPKKSKKRRGRPRHRDLKMDKRIWNLRKGESRLPYAEIAWVVFGDASKVREVERALNSHRKRLKRMGRG